MTTQAHQRLRSERISGIFEEIRNANFSPTSLDLRGANVMAAACELPYLFHEEVGNVRSVAIGLSPSYFLEQAAFLGESRGGSGRGSGSGEGVVEGDFPFQVVRGRFIIATAIFMQRARCGPESCCEHELIVSFRGTKDLYDWFYNLDFRSWSGSGDLHNGFVAAFKFDRAALVDGLVNLLDRVLGSGCSNGCEEKAGLILAGHSLGGAIAQVASLGANRFDYDNGIGDWLTEVECGVRKRMRNRSSVPNLRPAGYLGRGWFELSSTYAFGSPKVSKSGVLGNGIRLAVVNHPDDLVPNLPPRILGFRRSKMALTRTGDELSQYRGIGLRLSDLRSLKRKLACHKIENYRLWLAG